MAWWLRHLTATQETSVRVSALSLFFLLAHRFVKQVYRVFFWLFLFSFTFLSSFFTHIETNQSLGGAKTGVLGGGGGGGGGGETT